LDTILNKEFMAKVELGDIFEINTRKGKSYFQCVKIDKLRWHIIKVFNQLFDETPSLETIVNVHDCYFIGFALDVAFKRKLVERVGNIPLLPNFELPKYMRDKHVVGGQFLGWHIIDTTTWKRQFVEKLSAEQRRLSPWGIWNDTLLKEKLESGWGLSNWS
jgi:hypothetical protein